VDLICSQPPARQPGLQLLTVIASSPRHWSGLLLDGTVFRLAAQLAPAVQEQPELQQQLLEVLQLAMSKAQASNDAVRLCADEELLARAIGALCEFHSLSCQVPQLLLTMLMVDKSAAVRQALLSSGALDYILQLRQHGAHADASCNEAALLLFDMLLSCELQGSRATAIVMGQKAVEAGAFAAWWQQLQSAAYPAAAIQDAMALVMLAYPQAANCVAPDGVLPLLLWLLRYALSGPVAQAAAGFDPGYAWFLDNQLSTKQQLLATMVRTLMSSAITVNVEQRMSRMLIPTSAVGAPSAWHGGRPREGPIPLCDVGRACGSGSMEASLHWMLQCESCQLAGC
jgi:hypothetical protein